jgi:polyhydroxybutyrate depolymerase
MLLRAVALLGVALVIAGCSPLEAKQSHDGTTVHTISVGGLERTYRLYKPTGLPAAAPMVVIMHGCFSDAQQCENRYGWDQLADDAKFVAAYPDGVGRAWNAGGCCGRPAQENIDDIGFINAAVNDISRNVGIDSARIYATGISNGGMMAYALACNSATFTAIGPVAATQLSHCSAPHPTSVIHIHGTADQVIRYDGGPSAGVAHIDGPPVPDVNAFWRNIDQCGAPSVTTNGAVNTSTAGCADNRSVVLITVDGGGHEWPTFATQRLWEFFAAHPR